MYIATALSAGVGVEFSERADFFRILESSTLDLTVIFYRGGSEIARAENVGAGYAERTAQEFDRVRISSAGGASSVQFVTRYGSDVRYDKAPTGLTQITGQQGEFAQAQATVTNASAQLLAARGDRKYLLIQNNDASGIIYINLTGAAATTANGIKLAPGQSIEIDKHLPSGAITAIGSIASNANVIKVEG